MKILLTKTVQTKWNGRTKQYYIDKGCKFTKIGDIFEVDVNDLKPYSEIKVEVQCDYCKRKYIVTYASYLSTVRDGKNACKHCNYMHVKETNKERYGVDCVFQADIIKEKARRTNLDRYGVKNVSQSNIIQDVIKENNLKKYCVTNTSKLDSTKEKVRETNRKKFGVDYPMQLNEFQENIKKTDIEKYGCHHTQAPSVIEKKKKTNIERYGCEFPIQNINILNKSIASRYKHGNFSCSKQQYKLYKMISGELNYPFLNFAIDVAFPKDKIAVEWDGSGHDMSVKMGKVTEAEFKRNENYRTNLLFENGWKIIRFITKKDVFPNNILELFNYCKSYIDNGGHKIIVYIDQNKIFFKEQYIDFKNIA